MKDIKAIPTTLHGIEYKSRLEARWALFLTISGIPFAYEPNGADTFPDFRIITTPPILVEVKGKLPNDQYINWLRQHGVHYIAVSGFFKGLRPLMVYIQERRGKTGLFTEHFSDIFPNRLAFEKACNHRFDL